MKIPYTNILIRLALTKLIEMSFENEKSKSYNKIQIKVQNDRYI